MADDQLKVYHKVLPYLFIPVCVLIVLLYGWQGYITTTERPGLHGDMYYYYRLTRPQFYIYNFGVAAIAFALIILQAKYLLYPNGRNLTKTFLAFAVFIALVIATGFYLESRFVPKG